MRQWERPVGVLLLTLAATALAACFDQWVFDHCFSPDSATRGLSYTLKSMGCLYPWVAAAVLLVVCDLKAHAAGGMAAWHGAIRKALLVLLSPLVAGGLAEAVKVAVCRPRPPACAFGQVPGLFDALAQAGSSAGGLSAQGSYGFCSGHSAVAFGAAFAMSRLLPGTRWVWLALAIGCAFTRVQSHAHCLSDVVFGAGMGWFAAWMVVAVIRRISRRVDARRGFGGMFWDFPSGRALPL